MGREMKTSIFAIAAMAAGLTFAASAQATTISGSINFGGGGNGYDPAGGSVPPGYGNDTGTTVAVGPGIEFGYVDTFNTDTADFTNTSLTIGDITKGFGAVSWEQTFTASTPGFFKDLTLVGGSFTGLSYGVSGDTLTVDWEGTYTQGLPFSGSYSDQFTFAGGVPEPTTWALMLIGFGGLGAAMRASRGKRVGAITPAG
jgi:hypothetical protein